MPGRPNSPLLVGPALSCQPATWAGAVRTERRADRRIAPPCHRQGPILIAGGAESYPMIRTWPRAASPFRHRSGTRRLVPLLFGRNHLGLHTGGLVPIESVGKRIFVARGEGALIRRCTSRCRRRAVSQDALGGGLVGAVLLGQEDWDGDGGEDADDDHDYKNLD